MEKDYFVAKSSTSKLFIGKNGAIIANPDEAVIYHSVGDCMRACIEANENLGKAAFKICQIGNVKEDIE